MIKLKNTATIAMAVAALAWNVDAAEKSKQKPVGSATQQDGNSQLDKGSVDQFLNAWPSKPKEVAAATIQKYGQPHEATSSMLIWHNNGPWKRTVVYRVLAGT